LLNGFIFKKLKNMKGRKYIFKKPIIYIALFILLAVILIFTITRFTKIKLHQPNSEKNISRNTDILRSLPYVDTVNVDPSEKSGVTVYKKDKVCTGYNIYTIRRLSTAELIDMEGKVINSWNHSPSKAWSNVELLPNGDLLAIGSYKPFEKNQKIRAQTNPKNRYLLRFNWKGELLWEKTIPAHHDVELSWDGSILLLSTNRKIVPEIHPEIIVSDNQIIKLDQDGNVLESESLYGIIKTADDIFPLQYVGVNNAGIIDIFHSNSIEKMHHQHLADIHTIYNLDNILISIRHQDRIAIINWPERKLVWAWGQNIISGPHDATLLENGNILLFDNGLERDFSRVIELDPLTKQIVWKYQADNPTDFFTLARGSAQRLPNGNTLMAESDKGLAFEVTEEGEIVWKFACPHITKKNKRATIERIKKYPLQLINEIIENHK
jgi:hypothetical protein